MKRITFVAIVLGLTLSLGNTAFGQDNAKNRLGFFLAASSGDIDEIGLGGIGEFRIADKVTLSPQLILYFPEDRGGYDVNYFEINVNANYYFYNTDIFEFYGLGGLNLTRAHWDDDNGNDDSDTELGLNLGGGINFEIGKSFVPFSELRFTIGDYDQFVISAGLKFNLK